MDTQGLGLARWSGSAGGARCDAPGAVGSREPPILAAVHVLPPPGPWAAAAEQVGTQDWSWWGLPLLVTSPGHSFDVLL